MDVIYGKVVHVKKQHVKKNIVNAMVKVISAFRHVNVRIVVIQMQRIKRLKYSEQHMVFYIWTKS
jgi:hypothetical protein